MPSRKKGWKVIVPYRLRGGGEGWWSWHIFDAKLRNQYPRRRKHEPPFRGKPAIELTEQEAKRAFSDAKRSGQEAKLVNAQGITVRHANKKEGSK